MYGADSPRHPQIQVARKRSILEYILPSQMSFHICQVSLGTKKLKGIDYQEERCWISESQIVVNGSKMSQFFV